MKLIKIKPLYLFFIIVATLTALYGCPRQEETEPDSTEDTVEESEAFIDEPAVKIEHTKFVSPCPQRTEEGIEVDCSRDENSSACDADRAVITCDHPSVDCEFGNLSDETELLELGPALIFVEFNCQLPESFTTEAKCDFYNGDDLVVSETIDIEIAVMQ